MIALEHQRPGLDFLAAQLAAGRLRRFDVLVNHLIVERHLEKPGVGRLLAVLETRRLEINDELLPFAMLLAGVLATFSCVSPGASVVIAPASHLSVIGSGSPKLGEPDRNGGAAALA